MTRGSGPRYRVAPTVAWREVGDKVFAVTVDGNLHAVDPGTGPFVWKRIARAAVPFDDLLAALLDEFEVEEPAARKDLQEFLDTLVQRGVVVRE